MRLILFDCDGTLVDSQHLILESMRQAFDWMKLPAPPDEVIRGIIGLSLPDAFLSLAGDGALPIPELVQAYKEAFFTARSRPDFTEPLFPGIREALDALRLEEDWLLGVATGKSRRGLLSVLEHHGLHDHFITLQTADDAPSKPHPGMVLRALEETGAKPEQAILIGDTTYDILMAKAAGVSSLGVGWGYHPPELLRNAGAAAMIEGSHELIPALRLWSGKVLS